jgi:hypothetical protein
MSLPDELNVIREHVQALIDYVGRAQISAQLEENRQARRAVTAAAETTQETEDKAK